MSAVAGIQPFYPVMRARLTVIYPCLLLQHFRHTNQWNTDFSAPVVHLKRSPSMACRPAKMIELPYLRTAIASIHVAACRLRQSLSSANSSRPEKAFPKYSAARPGPLSHSNPDPGSVLVPALFHRFEVFGLNAGNAAYSRFRASSHLSPIARVGDC